MREGRRVGIIATGLMTARALDAAAVLAREGIDAGVLHVPTIKPFDAAAVVDFGREVDRLVTAENHVTSGGLATLVCEALFDAGVSKRLVRVGLPDQFIECGSVPFLQDRYGLTAAKLLAALPTGLKRGTCNTGERSCQPSRNASSPRCWLCVAGAFGFRQPARRRRTTSSSAAR